VRIDTPLEDFQVLQHKNGHKTLELEGTYKVRSPKDQVICRVYFEQENLMVAEEKPAMKNGRWQCTFELQAGTIYRIETGLLLKETGFDGRYVSRGDIVRHVGVGEVFLVAGQSNAVGYAREALEDGPEYGVFMYDRLNKWSLASHPIGHVDASKANASILMSGHSPWLAFGKKIYREKHMPVGIVPLALNGSFIEQWYKASGLFKQLIDTAKNAGHLIFYQGCSDTRTMHQHYQARLHSFIGEVRKTAPALKIYLIQISGTTMPGVEASGWNVVREAQRSVATAWNIPLITTYDLKDYSDDIHIGAKDNLKIAQRMYRAYTKGPSVQAKFAYRHSDGTIRIELTKNVPLRVPKKIPIRVHDAEGNDLQVERIKQCQENLYIEHKPGQAQKVSLTLGAYCQFEPIQSDDQPLSYFSLSLLKEKTANNR